jgi:hypothetical protein
MSARSVTSLAFCSLLTLVGCSASTDPSTGSTGESSAEINGSPRREQAIAIRNAYVAADVSELTALNPDLESVPAAAKKDVDTYVALNPSFGIKMESANSLPTPVGKVYIVELSVTEPSWKGYNRELSFYNEFGTKILRGVQYFPWDGTPSTGMRYFWASELPGTDQLLE